jgi:hypothetical protein
MELSLTIPFTLSNGWGIFSVGNKSSAVLLVGDRFSIIVLKGKQTFAIHTLFLGSPGCSWDVHWTSRIPYKSGDAQQH